MNDEHDPGDSDPDDDGGYDDDGGQEPIPDSTPPTTRWRRVRAANAQRAAPRRAGQGRRRPRPADKYRTHAGVRHRLAGAEHRPAPDRGAGGDVVCVWWRHREVSMRLYALWRAWESARTGDDTAMSIWWVAHADRAPAGDPGRRRRPDAPLPRRPPRRPADVAGRPGARSLVRQRPGPRPGHPAPLRLPARPARGRDANGKPGAARRCSPVSWNGSRCGSRRASPANCPATARAPPGVRSGGATARPRIRLHALWRAWEAAVDDGGAAVSLWWTHGLDPHLRVLLDGTAGPLYRCSTAGHRPAGAAGHQPGRGGLVRPPARHRGRTPGPVRRVRTRLPPRRRRGCGMSSRATGPAAVSVGGAVLT